MAFLLVLVGKLAEAGEAEAEAAAVPAEFEAVLAHELLHAWLHQNKIKLSLASIEGFCNLGSYLIYKNDNTHFSSIHIKAMATSKDLVYGKGYREMKVQLEKQGWEKLIADLSSY